MKNIINKQIIMVLIFITLSSAFITAIEFPTDSHDFFVYGNENIDGIRQRVDRLTYEFNINYYFEDASIINLSTNIEDIVENYGIKKHDGQNVDITSDMCVIKENENINTINCKFQETFQDEFSSTQNVVQLLYRVNIDSGFTELEKKIIFQDIQAPSAANLIEGQNNEPIVKGRNVFLQLNITDEPNPGCSGIQSVKINGLDFYIEKDRNCEFDLEVDISQFLSEAQRQGKVNLSATATLTDYQGNSRNYTWQKELDFRLLDVRDNFLIDTSTLERTDRFRVAKDVFLCYNLTAIKEISPDAPVYIESFDLNTIARLGVYAPFPNSHCTIDPINLFDNVNTNIKAQTVDGEETIDKVVNFNVVKVPRGPRVSKIQIGEFIQDTQFNAKFSKLKLRNFNKPNDNIFINNQAYFTSLGENRIKVRLDWEGSDFNESQLQLELNEEAFLVNSVSCSDLVRTETAGSKECVFQVLARQELPNNAAYKISYNKNIVDNVGNLLDNVNSLESITIVNDVQGPELVEYNQLDLNRLNPYISQFSSFVLKANINDFGSGLDTQATYMNFAELTEDPTVDAIVPARKCSPTGSRSYECEFQFTAQVPPGYYNVTLHAFDQLNNKREEKVEVTVFEYVNGTDWFYFDVDKMVPQAFDRSSLHKASGKVFLFGKIKSVRPGAEIISVQTESQQQTGCWAENIPIPDFERFINSTQLRLLGQDENGYTNFQIVVASNVIKDPTPDTITIKCPFRLRGVSGTQVISDENSEFDELEFTLSFVNKRSAMLSESVATKIIQAGDDKLFSQKWIGKLSKVVNILKRICHLAKTLDRLYGALTKLRPGVYIVATATKPFGGEALWKSFNQGVEQIRCGVGPLQPNSGILGFMRKACEIANCEGKHNIIAEKVTGKLDNVINKAAQKYQQTFDGVLGGDSRTANLQLARGINPSNSNIATGSEVQSDVGCSDGSCAIDPTEFGSEGDTSRGFLKLPDDTPIDDGYVDSFDPNQGYDEFGIPRDPFDVALGDSGLDQPSFFNNEGEQVQAEIYEPPSIIQQNQDSFVNDEVASDPEFEWASNEQIESEAIVYCDDNPSGAPCLERNTIPELTFTGNAIAGDPNLPNQITGDAAAVLTAFSKQSHSGNSLINAIGMRCIGGITDALQRKRVIQCEYINCLWEVGKEGGNIAQCDAYKSFANCKFVAGEISSILPSLNLFKKIAKDTEKGLKELPVKKLQGVIDKKGGGLLRQIQNCKNTLKLSGYVQQPGQPAPVSFKACGRNQQVPPLESSRALRVIMCGLVESALQKKDLKEILFPVEGVKDSLKQLKIEDSEDLCQEAEERVKKAKEIKDYIDAVYVPARIATNKATVEESATDQAALDKEFENAAGQIDLTNSSGGNESAET